MLEHGGQLRKAAQQYGITENHWLDLSTGINPLPYPAPPIPANAWHRLPQDQDDLLQHAEGYYGSEHILPVAGTQAAIQLLPRLRKCSKVAVLHPTYAEHAHAWRTAGHEVLVVTAENIPAIISEIDVLVLVNPNNPSGYLFPREHMNLWLERLQARTGWLIVDEAFIDASHVVSMIRPVMPPGLVVLRSPGKFFGLAGARTGFMLADQTLLQDAQEMLGPWTVSGASRFVVSTALKDTHWQATTRTRLQLDSMRLHRLLQDAGLPPSGGTALFQWVMHDDAARIHEHLARRGILTRLYTDPRSLRFGMPGYEEDWQRLQDTLTQVMS